MKKYIVLAVMLIIPACLFLFLKFQGKNHFQLEVMVPAFGTDCSNIPNEIDSNYQIPSFSYPSDAGNDFSGNDLDDHISIVHFLGNSALKKVLNQMNELERVQSVIVNKEEFGMFTLYGSQENEESQTFFGEVKEFKEESSLPWNVLSIEHTNTRQLSQCALGLGFGLATEANLVLIDKERRIRGYYNGNEREEIDRLITELQVLEFEYK